MRTKFCGQMSKATKAKAKVNKSHQNWMKSKYYAKTFHEISLILWNFINFCKISRFLIKFCKSPRRFELHIAKKLSNIGWISLTIVHAMKNGGKLGKLCTKTLTNVHSIQWRFSRSKTFGFNEILSCFILLMTENFCFAQISQLPRASILSYYSF
jgi:hypothetical protein